MCILTVAKISWSSVCRGAALWGLQHSSRNGEQNSHGVQSRVARYSFGIRIPYTNNGKKDRFWDDESVRSSIDSRIDEDRMVWLVKQASYSSY